jgi:hypothetical protein
MRSALAVWEINDAAATTVAAIARLLNIRIKNTPYVARRSS